MSDGEDNYNEAPLSPDNEQEDNAPASPAHSDNGSENQEEEQNEQVSETNNDLSQNSGDEDAGQTQEQPDSDDDEVIVRKSKAIIDSDDEDSDAAGPSAARDASPPRAQKKRIVDSDSDDSGDEKDPLSRKLLGSDVSDDDDDNQKKQDIGGVDIFGDDSDDDEPKTQQSGEQGEFEESAGQEEESAPNPVDSDDDDELLRDEGGRGKNRGSDEGFEWDFDAMMRKKKLEKKRRVRKRDNGIDIINDDDGQISRLVERMKAAAKSDRHSNMERKAAFQKVKMLPEVKLMLIKAGLTEALIDNGMMSAVSEWLAPLPDKCLPALDIRVTLLKLLHNPRFWKLDSSILRQSGLGKAVMLLYKHPNETKENKRIAWKLISEWMRPVYGLETDYGSMSRDERTQRDFERMPAAKKARLSVDTRDDDEERRDRRQGVQEDDLDDVLAATSSKGEKGGINRARVPKPSTRDYVIRPKWNVEGEFKGERKSRGTSRYEQAFREFSDRTKKNKSSRAVKVSLEGRNMAL